MLNRTTIEEKLLEADAKAAEGITNGLSGPFGSSIYLLTPANDLLQVGITTNGVRLTGDPCAHGEDQAIRKFSDATVAALKKNPGSKAILFTSAEPCPNCRAKLELFARYLMAQNLIGAKDFISYFGATYDDTQDIAGFLDRSYADEFKRPATKRKLKIHRQKKDNLDASLQKLVTDKPFSILQTKDGCTCSTDSSWIDTPETVVIRTQGLKQLESGNDQPWDMNGAKLYTSQIDIGPMVYATCLWANIGEVISIETPCAQQREAKDLSNADFFSIIAGPYNTPKSLVHIEGCDSVRPKLKAQRLWRDLLASGTLPPTALYNGVKI